MSLKQKDEKRRKVFKPFLDTPFTQSGWVVPDNNEDGENIVDILINTSTNEFILGFNENVKYLESNIQQNVTNSMEVLFVCRSELSTNVTAQLPTICALSGTRLIQLPQGSMSKLVPKHGDKAGIIGLKQTTKSLQSFLDKYNLQHYEWASNLTKWHEPNIQFTEKFIPPKK